MPEGGFVDPDAKKSTFPTATGGTKPTGPIGGVVGQDIIKIRHPVRGQDASGARVIRYEDWEPDIIKATFVTIASTSLRPLTIHEFGHEGEELKYKLSCGIKLRYRDQVLWVSQGEIYTVIRSVRNKDDTTVWDHLVVDFTV